MAEIQITKDTEKSKIDGEYYINALKLEYEKNGFHDGDLLRPEPIKGDNLVSLVKDLDDNLPGFSSIFDQNPDIKYYPEFQDKFYDLGKEVENLRNTNPKSYEVERKIYEKIGDTLYLDAFPRSSD